MTDQHSSGLSDDAMRAVADIPGAMRAGDADREATVARVRRAYVEARLTLAEFDTRTAAAWAATTRAELQALVADLPPAAPEPPIVPPSLPQLPVATAPRRNKGQQALHVLSIIWLTATIVNVAVWTLVCVGGMQWIYPWWLWVAVPPGAALAVITRCTRKPIHW